jgi:hypothetical protein
MVKKKMEYWKVYKKDGLIKGDFNVERTGQ